MLLRFFRTPALSPSSIQKVITAPRPISLLVKDIQTEYCYYVDIDGMLNSAEIEKLQWLLAETFLPAGFSDHSFLDNFPQVLEVGPRLNFETAFSSTATSICHECGITQVRRLERSIRYGLGLILSAERAQAFLDPIHDHMTQMPYPKPLETLESSQKPEPGFLIPVLTNGVKALRDHNNREGLAMDEQDFEIYFQLFAHKEQRDPSDTELFQCGQANSDHSRHHTYTGIHYIDGVQKEKSLMEIIKTPWRTNPGNSRIAFADNSSAIDPASPSWVIIPNNPGFPSAYHVVQINLLPTASEETHNFPSQYEPYEGASTGIGGLLRDYFSVGEAGIVIVCAAGFCCGNIIVPNYMINRDDGWRNLPDYASPLQILIGVSNGAYDYGNCMGVPTTYGYTRSFGMQVGDEYRAWFKPIVYVGGLGQMNELHIKKQEPQKGDILLQIGGPAYRIGVGGGARSSVGIEEEENAHATQLNLQAVQRGCPEMEQRDSRVVQTFMDLGDKNPAVSVHDEGAAGSMNALTENSSPAGADIELRALPSGDKTLSKKELWGNEAQERIVARAKPEKVDFIKYICQREGAPIAEVGVITGSGRIVVHDAEDDSIPVNLPLDDILENLPRKAFKTEKRPKLLTPLSLSKDLTIGQALDRVLRQVDVCSKAFLTRKVDRSVSGLICQQQCVGSNHLPLADFTAVAQGHFSDNGIVSALGEQPYKGFISAQAQARLSIAEALLNLAGAKITKLQDIKCGGNWMWAAKMPGEAALIYDAAEAMCDMMVELGIAIDGGKDSSSMVTKALSPSGEKEPVKAPGELVFEAYAPMPDVNCKVGPVPNYGDHLIHIDLSPSKKRLGGSILARAYGQIGDECPDVDNINSLEQTFNAVQELVAEGLISACHDVSDGGLIVTVLEMAFAANAGLYIATINRHSAIETYFAEEPGVVIACSPQDEQKVWNVLSKYSLRSQSFTIGSVHSNTQVVVLHNQDLQLLKDMTKLRATWDETSTQIDRLQTNPECVEQERKLTCNLTTPPPYTLTFEPKVTSNKILSAIDKPKVAILRTWSSNGDREMAAAFYLAGFEPWDITMTDLVDGRITLEQFRGIAFVGGFAFGDVLDAAKGWAGIVRFNGIVMEQFDTFYHRQDTFSLGVCNGCQLMALLGWVPWYGTPGSRQPRFIRNKSERFESRFPAVYVAPSPSIMLSGMEGSVLGIWSAHGEGRLYVPEQEMLDEICDRNLAPLRFVDHNCLLTEDYPFNPNGSPKGITALCSEDGRHLAMMPHPERTFQLRHWPWLPQEWKNLEASPWLHMFQNAYQWSCDHNK